jgi:hypothetical protein
MPGRGKPLFALLILAQSAHSVEEYVFRLYDVFAPARFISGLVSSDLALGFAVVNTAFVAFGVWCYFARVRTGHPSSAALAWFWTVLEGANGTAHLLLAASERGYFPGAWTAPLLLGLSVSLGAVLARGITPGSSPVR